MLYKISVLTNLPKFTANFLLLVLLRIGLVWPAINILMFCTIDCTSVLKALSRSTEMQFSTDLALMRTQPTY